MVNTLNGLEKAIAEMKLQSQKTADQIEALSFKLDTFIWEIRAFLASPLLTFPKFDGSGALVWLARANQYFLIHKTPSDRRVDVAIDAMSGPATPWLKLLLMRRSSLSWDKFTQELLRRFGDTSPPESRVQHDFHTPGAQPLAHINNTKSHNLNTKPIPRLHPTPAQESAHIKEELIGQRQEDVKTLAPDSQLKYSPLLLADPVLEPAPLLLPSQKGVTPHAYDSQPKDLVMFSAENKTAVLCPAPVAEDSTKPEISSPTPEGHRHPSSPPPPQPLPLALPQQPPLHNMELVPQPTPVPALVIATIHNLEAVSVSTQMSASDARRNRVLHPLPTKHFTTIYFSSQSTVLCGQLFSSFNILHGLLFCTLLSSLKHESATPWLISTIALRARLFRE